MELHYASGSVATAVAIALEEAGLDYTAVPVDFANQAQTKPAYLAVNPKGRVPALVTPQGVLTETGAILEHIGRGTALIPDAPIARTRLRELMFYLAATMHVAHAHKHRGARWADQQSSRDDMTAKVPQTMTACCAYLEDTYHFAPFVLGDTITVGDAYVFIALRWATGDGVDMTAFPKLTAHRDMMEQRASVRTVREKGIMG